MIDRSLGTLPSLPRLTVAQWCAGLGFDLPLHVQDRPVTGIALDSREVTAGDCFLVYPLHDGRGQQHGGQYISAALANGAGLVLVDSDIAADELQIPAQRAGVVLPVTGLRHAIGELCARFFGHPSRRLPVIAITGTNGKTSCAHFLAQAPALVSAPTPSGQQRGGMIGTLGWGLLDALHDSRHTTPDALQLQWRLAKLCQLEPQLVAMEASSHALAQRRTSACRFSVAAITNLSQDHLDYHLNMQAYAAAKLKLFTEHEVEHMLVSVDDPYCRNMHQQLLQLGHGERVLTTSTVPQHRADICVQAVASGNLAANRQQTRHGMRIQVQSPWGSGEIQTGLLGHFNLHNLATVIGALGQLGWSWTDITDVLQGLQPVPGRMQLLPGLQQPLIIVDYAHTPDALETVLGSAREFCRGRLFCVFGCGGDRDRGKRARMGEIAGRLADSIVITSDNPRHEAPEQIISEIRSGVASQVMVQCQPDRRLAITMALQQASCEDVVIIAGKGHERHQQIGHQRLVFDDAAIAAEIAASLLSEHEHQRDAQHTPSGVPA
ncbi:MAG: UDP-N-acetylmuramoyl-L-alanyl-D-glutamate--2,6-diaminopimelate ligase [Gammaproteobacteria bacterium]|nr:UDP-N-acetylmuramoyl-L-alanyl-D-glutamate--2,6-diaminopimelate ligase [Gammaproteobacteria bacterium]